MENTWGKEEEDPKNFAEEYRKTTEYVKKVFEKEFKHLKIELGSEGTSDFKEKSRRVSETLKKAGKYIEHYFAIKESYKNKEPYKINENQSVIILDYDKYKADEECEYRLKKISEKFAKVEESLKNYEEQKKQIDESKKKCKELEEEVEKLKEINTVLEEGQKELTERNKVLTQSEKSLKEELKKSKEKISDVRKKKKLLEKEIKDMQSNQEQTSNGKRQLPKEDTESTELIDNVNSKDNVRPPVNQDEQENFKVVIGHDTKPSNDETGSSQFPDPTHPSTTPISSTDASSPDSNQKSLLSKEITDIFVTEIPNTSNYYYISARIITSEYKIIFIIDSIYYPKFNETKFKDIHPVIQEYRGNESCTTVDIIITDIYIYKDYSDKLKKIASRLIEKGLTVNVFAFTQPYCLSQSPPMEWRLEKLEMQYQHTEHYMCNSYTY